MKIKSWHISTGLIVAIVAGIFVIGGTRATSFGAILLLALFPALVWFGWTLKERSTYRNQEIEERVMNRLRQADSIVSKRRKVTAND